MMVVMKQLDIAIFHRNYRMTAKGIFSFVGVKMGGNEP